MLNRRAFLQRGCRALAAAPLYSSLSHAAIPPAVLKRIGITTVCFRERFKETRTKGAPPPPEGDLTLLAAPKFIADQLGLHNVEVWDWQFADKSLEYCRQLKAEAAKVGSTFLNIQLDSDWEYDISSPDKARRDQSIEFARQWLDRAKAIGSPRLRINSGGTAPGEPWSLERTAASYRQLTEYGKKIGVKVLVENHIGFSGDIDKAVAIVKAVNDPNCRLISDWGNVPAKTEEQRVASLKKMFPDLDLVSAKEVDFDGNRHISYDIVPIIQATEAAGFRGIYSIEMWTAKAPPRDPVAAARTFVSQLAAHIRA
jgi:sugar phosphate isomerase/epimerase